MDIEILLNKWGKINLKNNLFEKFVKLNYNKQYL